MSDKPKAAETQVVTGRVRFSYLNVFKPRAFAEGDEPEFSVALLIPKSDKETIRRLSMAANAALKARWPNLDLSQVRNSLRDGDKEKPGDEAYADHFFLNVRSKQKPGLREAGVHGLQEVMDPDKWTSGDYGHADLNAFAYDNKGKGVSFGLNNLVFVAKGEPLSSRRTADDAFKDLDISMDAELSGGQTGGSVASSLLG